VNIAGLNPVDRLAIRDILLVNGFVFEKQKCRKPGTRDIVEHSVGVRLLDKKTFGRVVIGVDLDSEKDQWFVAPTWEASQLSPEKIHEIKDGKMKLAAATLISKVETEFGSSISSQPEAKKSAEPEQKNGVKSRVLSDLTDQPEAPLDEKKKQAEEQNPAPAAVAQNTQPESLPPSEPPVTAAVQPVYEPEPNQLQIIKNVGQAKVSLIKNTKGYNWEITAYSDTMNDAIDQAIAADLRLRNQLKGDA